MNLSFIDYSITKNLRPNIYFFNVDLVFVNAKVFILEESIANYFARIMELVQKEVLIFYPLGNFDEPINNTSACSLFLLVYMSFKSST